MIGCITVGAGVAAVTAARVRWAIARRLTTPVGPLTFDLTNRGVEHDGKDDLIVLGHTDQTTAPGSYHLWSEHGSWASYPPRSSIAELLAWREGSPALHLASPRRSATVSPEAASARPHQPTPGSVRARSPSPLRLDLARRGALTATLRRGRSTSTGSAALDQAPSAASSPRPNSATPRSSSAIATPPKGRESAPGDQPSSIP